MEFKDTVRPKSPEIKSDEIKIQEKRFMCPIATNSKYNCKTLRMDDLSEEERMLLMDEKQLKHPRINLPKCKCGYMIIPPDPRDQKIEQMQADMTTMHAVLSQVIQQLNAQNPPRKSAP